MTSQDALSREPGLLRRALAGNVAKVDEYGDAFQLE